MKTEIEVIINEETLRNAEQYAKLVGKSLSTLVEEFFTTLTVN